MFSIFDKKLKAQTLNILFHNLRLELGLKQPRITVLSDVIENFKLYLGLCHIMLPHDPLGSYGVVADLSDVHFIFLF